MSPAQERDISLIPYLVITSEALRMHEKAIAAREWANVDYTLRQYADIQWDYNFHVSAHTEQRVAQLKKYRQSGKKGGRKSHDWETICCRYDTLIAAGKQRADVTTILRQTYEIRGDDLNRGLRARGRGKRAKNTPDNKAKAFPLPCSTSYPSFSSNVHLTLKEGEICLIALPNPDLRHSPTFLNDPKSLPRSTNSVPSVPENCRRSATGCTSPNETGSKRP